MFVGAFMRWIPKVRVKGARLFRRNIRRDDAKSEHLDVQRVTGRAHRYLRADPGFASPIGDHRVRHEVKTAVDRKHVSK
jgi:hypothetical protein